MWLKDMLEGVTPEMLAEVQTTFVPAPYDGLKFRVIGEIPSDLHWLFARRHTLSVAKKRAQLATADQPATESPEWYEEQIVALNVVITMSLIYAGISADYSRLHVIGEGWKMLEVLERKVILADSDMTALFGHAQLVAGALLSGRKPTQSRSTVRVGA